MDKFLNIRSLSILCHFFPKLPLSSKLFQPNGKQTQHQQISFLFYLLPPFLFLLQIGVLFTQWYSRRSFSIEEINNKLHRREEKNEIEIIIIVGDDSVAVATSSDEFISHRRLIKTRRESVYLRWFFWCENYEWHQ